MASATNLPEVFTSQAVLLDVQDVESGVPLSALSDFLAASGLQMKDIYDIVIPARTLKHRRANQESFTRDESDKLARLIRIYDHTLRVFGNPVKALRFLCTPKQRLDDRTPLQLLQTEVGGRKVEGMLWQIADGVFI